MARERPAGPLPGWKLARTVVSADGTRGAFTGVTIGQATVYGVSADASCAQRVRHRSPSRWWCDCGFYCLHTLAAARELACDPDYAGTVLLEVAASGRFVRYERGLRYAHQRVVAVRTRRCRCGQPATAFAETGAGRVGWRYVEAVCPICAGTRATRSTAEFGQLLGGLPVTLDDDVAPGPGGPGTPLDAAAEATLIPLLTAEVALLQARLDEVQRQLARLTEAS